MSFNLEFQDSEAELLTVDTVDTDKDIERNPLRDISSDPEPNDFPDQSPTFAIYDKSQIRTTASPSFKYETETSSELHQPSHLTDQDKMLVDDKFGSPNFSSKSIVSREVDGEESSNHVENCSSSETSKSQEYSPPKVNLLILLFAF